MKTRIGAAFVLWACLLAGATALAKEPKSSTEAYLDRLHSEGKERIIVRFKDEAKVDTSLVGKHGGKLIRTFTSIKGLVCEMPQGKLAALQSEGAVKHTFPDATVRIEPGWKIPAEENEPAKKEGGGISPESYTGSVTVRWNNLEAGMNTKAAWDNYGLDGSGVKIAFLDTGVNYNLTNLYDSYLGGTDFVEDDGDPLTINTNEDHGTEVISLAVGRGISKVVGVAYRVSFYAVKMMDTNGAGFVSDAISGIEWALTEPRRADIISMSFGVYDVEPGLKEAFEAACNYAYSQGIALVAASGNEGYSYSQYPAAFDNVISVGAHAEDQTLYNYGGYSSNGGVDIVAPGARVYSVDPANYA
jgi:hypothetical protein